MAMALLFQSIPEALLLQVGELDTAKKVWEAIKTRHMGAERVREARLQTLMAEFDRLKMKETETIDDFAGKLSEISSKFIQICSARRRDRGTKDCQEIPEEFSKKEVYSDSGIARTSLGSQDYKF